MEVETKRNSEYEQINQLYDECLNYLKENKHFVEQHRASIEDPDYETIRDQKEDRQEDRHEENEHNEIGEAKTVFKLENEKSMESLNSVISEPRSERLRKLSKQLPKIIITQSTTSLDLKKDEIKKPLRGEMSKSDRVLPKIDRHLPRPDYSMPVINHHHQNVLNFDSSLKERDSMSSMDRKMPKSMKPYNHVSSEKKKVPPNSDFRHPQRTRPGYGDHPKRLVSKTGMENIALISNVPFEKIRLLNDTFHTLINLRWRWIVIGTIVVHFAIWLVFAVFWYITALAHYDFEPDPPKKTCVTGGKDFVTIFLASVEAQTTIGFGDRAIDEECPESIFLFIMQLILGTGLSGVLTCVVYAKLTRPEKLSRDGVGFSKKAVISMRDGRLCLMMRAWDLNYDHIISSEFTAHFVNTYRTKEGEVIRYYARCLTLQQRQFLLWPVTLVHVIDETSPLFGYTPELIAHNSYEITVSLKGASASMGTFTQSQTSYLPKEVAWGFRFPPVVKYDSHKQKYVIDHKKLDLLEPVDTPYSCARDIYRNSTPIKEPPPTPGTPSNFSEKVSSFQLARSSSFRQSANNKS
ncbi:ATP-sensitive inward rectifier potassium channel 10-like isoform X2 [Spodoptera litura]|uniref:ATP-sensitive inward rectifier potassium channel 10-like isoform X2 n=1 Tax=Spodoptera litura TaxID=69820 RepID=A0A9J7EXL9_SPOLT|nr:ATP-sensitive inward rectifier potassium channel 10-like isoform X2 [Spodoptera litura]